MDANDMIFVNTICEDLAVFGTVQLKFVANNSCGYNSSNIIGIPFLWKTYPKVHIFYYFFIFFTIQTLIYLETP